jgi:hypothetical protein
MLLVLFTSICRPQDRIPLLAVLVVLVLRLLAALCLFVILPSASFIASCIYSTRIIFAIQKKEKLH